VQGNPAIPQGIEGVEMGKVYYNRVKNTHILLPALASLALAAIPLHSSSSGPFSPIAQQNPTRPLTAAALDSHEGLTIAADPWLSADRYKTDFPKKTPISAGVVAIKVTFRNDSDESIKIGLERIRLNLSLDENNRQALPPLSSDELTDTVLHPKIKANAPRLPLPLPTSGGGRDKHWQEYKKLAENAGLHDAVVAPHGTVSGLLYFDLQNQFDLLQNARLYIPDLMSLEKNRNLMFFDIDLSRPSPK
jgi:hypothetical protein